MFVRPVTRLIVSCALPAGKGGVRGAVSTVADEHPPSARRSNATHGLRNATEVITRQSPAATPDALTMARQRSVSRCINSANSSGVVALISNESLLNPALTSGTAKALRTA